MPSPIRRVRRLWSHRALGVASWAEHARAVAGLRRDLDRPARMSRGADVVLVINSFARPQNMGLICWLALRAPSIRRIVISNNDPTVDLGCCLGFDDPRLEVRRRATRRGPMARYTTAREVGGRLFLSVDDDLFLGPDQLELLAHRLRAAPEAPHGFYGQLFRDGAFHYNRGLAEGQVDVLNRAYAFTDAHLARYFELVDALGITRPDAVHAFTMDDVPLAFCGATRPFTHDIGPYVDCESEHDPRIAIFRKRGEHVRRAALFRRLETVAALPRDRFRDAPAITVSPSPRRLSLAIPYYASGIGFVLDRLLSA
ncbi:MAG: hypothetical protein SangKO_061780 [Sandaracinaceae bacterium]